MGGYYYRIISCEERWEELWEASQEKKRPFRCKNYLQISKGLSWGTETKVVLGGYEDWDDLWVNHGYRQMST